MILPCDTKFCRGNCNIIIHTKEYPQGQKMCWECWERYCQNV